MKVPKLDSNHKNERSPILLFSEFKFTGFPSYDDFQYTKISFFVKASAYSMSIQASIFSLPLQISLNYTFPDNNAETEWDSEFFKLNFKPRNEVSN